MYSIIAFCLVLATWVISSLAAPIDSLLHPQVLPRAAVRPTLTGSPVVLGAGPGTYPRATSLRDGSILGIYTSFESGSNILRTSTSTNNGASWSLKGKITRGASNANDIDNAFVIQLPNSNRILCAFRNHSKDPNTGAYAFFRITITYSDDGGATWRYLSQPASDNGPVLGNWEPYLRNAADGSLQLYYSRENSAQDQDTLMRTSRDGGASWTSATCVSGCGTTARDGMTSVATLSSPQSLILIYETSGSAGTFTLGAVFSSDDGRTWSGRRTIYTPSSPNTSAGAPQIAKVGATLVISFMTNEDMRLSVPSRNYIERTAVKVITSGDAGRTWGNKVTVGAEQSSWPGVMDLRGGRGQFLYLLDTGMAKSQLVMLT